MQDTEIWNPLQNQYYSSTDNIVPSSFCLTLPFDADDIGPKADKTRLLLVCCWVKNSSNLWTILMSSGVVERDIMRCSRSQVRLPCTNTSTDLQDAEQTEHKH